jgi:putative lipase involved disintegration of autophagic bodies
VVIASCVYNVVNNKYLDLDIEKLYGDDGIAEILRDSTARSAEERIPCDENYLWQKARELQSMPEPE